MRGVRRLPPLLPGRYPSHFLTLGNVLVVDYLLDQMPLLDLLYLRESRS